jgi:hypothetical protein
MSEPPQETPIKKEWCLVNSLAIERLLQESIKTSAEFAEVYMDLRDTNQTVQRLAQAVIDNLRNVEINLQNINTNIKELFERVTKIETEYVHRRKRASAQER